MILAALSLLCLPPPPGMPEPTLTERIRPVFEATPAIVYGQVVRAADARRPAQVRVIHSYRGALGPGSVVEGSIANGLDPPPCGGMTGWMPPARGAKGDYGVMLVDPGARTLRFIEPHVVEAAFAAGWIARARP